MAGFQREALRFSVLRIWPNFGSVFRFSQLKTAVFQFWCLGSFAGFSNVVFGFRFLSKMIAVFWIFLSNAFSAAFLVLPRKSHPAVALKL